MKKCCENCTYFKKVLLTKKENEEEQIKYICTCFSDYGDSLTEKDLQEETDCTSFTEKN